jgi:predicted Ser/Thr protein kinase
LAGGGEDDESDDNDKLGGIKVDGRKFERYGCRKGKLFQYDEAASGGTKGNV